MAVGFYIVHCLTGLNEMRMGLTYTDQSRNRRIFFAFAFHFRLRVEDILGHRI